MSRSKRKTPIFKVCICKSSKFDKTQSNRKFRKLVKSKLMNPNFTLPTKSAHVSNVWRWESDGKFYWKDVDKKFMRK